MLEEINRSISKREFLNGDYSKYEKKMVHFCAGCDGVQSIKIRPCCSDCYCLYFENPTSGEDISGRTNVINTWRDLANGSNGFVCNYKMSILNSKWWDLYSTPGEYCEKVNELNSTNHTTFSVKLMCGGCRRFIESVDIRESTVTGNNLFNTVLKYLE